MNRLDSSKTFHFDLKRFPYNVMIIFRNFFKIPILKLKQSPPSAFLSNVFLLINFLLKSLGSFILFQTMPCSRITLAHRRLWDVHPGWDSGRGSPAKPTRTSKRWLRNWKKIAAVPSAFSKSLDLWTRDSNVFQAPKSTQCVHTMVICFSVVCFR